MIDSLTDAALSTSVYELNGVRGVATLNDAGYPTCVPFDQQAEAGSVHPRYIQMQIVKRNKTLALFVDGRRVSPSPKRAVPLLQ